jgi:hypothetical protein
MTNERILEIAMRQFAIDANCQVLHRLVQYQIGPECHKKRL